MSDGIDMMLHPGKQTLHGKELLEYARFRKDEYGDFGRVERQQKVLEKIKEQAVNITSLTKLPKILGTVNANIDTNVDYKTLLTIRKGLIEGNSGDIETLRIPM